MPAEFKIIFALIIFAISFGIPLIQFIRKQMKILADKQGTSVPNEGSNEIFWEDEIVEEEYEENDDAIYFELKEAREEQRAQVVEDIKPVTVDEFEYAQPEPATVPVRHTPEPEEERHHYDDYAGFLRNNLRSSIVASEIRGTPKGLQE